jgi:nucleoid-associated protein YgaU
MPYGFQEELTEMKKSIRSITGVAALSLAMILVIAAGAFAVDVSKGQFYTEEEYQKLGKKEREAYCASLASEQETLKGRLADATTKLDAENAEVKDLKAKITDVDGKLNPVNKEVADLEKQIKELEALPKEWTVKKGESLSKISGYTEIYSHPAKWPRIYRANKDRIEDPNLIYPGWILRIPRGLPTSHMVVEGEWLAKISGYWEIYGDWRQWTRIYEANKDKIKDPDVIMPGWDLKVPR